MNVRLTRLPAPVSEGLPEFSDDEVIEQQLDLAESMKCEAMTVPDWEIAERNIDRGRDLLSSVQQQLELKAQHDEPDERVVSRCNRLTADLARASTLLTMRIGRPSERSPL